jgi:putative heme-binding domain-containing protein
LEHAAMFAGIATSGVQLDTLSAARSPTLIRRLMLILEQVRDPEVQDALLEQAKRHFEAAEPDLAATAIAIAARHPRVLERSIGELKTRLDAPQIGAGTLRLIAEVAEAQLAQPAAQTLVTRLLQHPSPTLPRTAWRIIARQQGNVMHADWLAPLEAALKRAVDATPGGDLSLLLEAVAKLQSPNFDAILRGLVNDAGRPEPLRLKALAAVSRPNEPIAPDAFKLLLQILREGASPAARVDAARLLARVKLSRDQQLEMAPVLATASPVELMQLLRPMQKKLDPVSARTWAEHIVRSPYFGSLEESVVKSGFQVLSSAAYESLLGPAVRAAAAVNDAKKRQVERLAGEVAKGRVAAGRALFENSACAACHKVGELGRAMGPDLTQIGRIRQPRDLLEAIIFPSASLARGYETCVVETGAGATMAVIKSETPEGLVVVDAAGQEKTIPHAEIIAQTPVTTSLMPAGLEQAFTEQQLLDVVAWLGAQQ